MKLAIFLFLVLAYSCDLQKQITIIDINQIIQSNKKSIDEIYGPASKIHNDSSIKLLQASYIYKGITIYIIFDKEKPVWIELFDVKGAKFDTNPLVYFGFDAYPPTKSLDYLKTWTNVPNIKKINVFTDRTNPKLVGSIMVNISRDIK